MTYHTNPFIIASIKWVLGENFIGCEDPYHVNTNITSRFIASLLDIVVPKHLVLQLTEEIFYDKHLDGMEEVVHYADPIWGIPTTSNLR